MDTTSPPSLVSEKKVDTHRRVLREVARLMRCTEFQAFISIGMMVWRINSRNCFEHAKRKWNIFRRGRNCLLPEKVYNKCIGILAGSDPITKVAREVSNGAGMRGVSARRKKRKKD